ncbi:MAG: prepilin peptidase [Acidisphaera sp.]|nr:prepilin peptidase [Acidisphaera sp.]
MAGSWLLAVILAPFIGSFLGVLIRRLPEGRPVATGRSVCESCGRPLDARDLVPLGSYLAFGGRCRTCRAPIGFFHFAVELAALTVALWAVAAEADPVRLWADCVLGWTLLALAWIDWQHFRLPDVLTLPLVLLGLGATAILQPADLVDHAAGAVAGYLAFRAIGAAYRRLRGREGLGQGDAKLLAAAGAWVGVASLPMVALVAALTGLTLAGLWRLGGRAMTATTRLPFGPCLAFALWIVWLYRLPPSF